MSYNRSSRYGGNQRHRIGQRNNDFRGGMNTRSYKDSGNNSNNLWNERKNNAASRSFTNEHYTHARNPGIQNLNTRSYRNEWYTRQEPVKSDKFVSEKLSFKRDCYQNDKNDLVGEVFRRVTQPSIGHCVRDVDERIEKCNYGNISNSGNTDFVGEVFRRVTGSNNDINKMSKHKTTVVERDDFMGNVDDQDAQVENKYIPSTCEKHNEDDWQNVNDSFSNDYDDNITMYECDDNKLMERHPFELPVEQFDSSVSSAGKPSLLPAPTFPSLHQTSIHTLLPPPSVQTLLPPPSGQASLLPPPVPIQNVASMPMPVPPPVPPGILSALKNRGVASASVPNSSLLNTSNEAKDNSVSIESALISLSNLQQQLVSNLSVLKENNRSPDFSVDIPPTANESSANLKKVTSTSNILSSVSTDVSVCTSTPSYASICQAGVVDVSASTSEELLKAEIVPISNSQEKRKRKASIVKDVETKSKIHHYLNTFMQDYHDRCKVVAILERDVSKLRQEISSGGNVRENKLDLIRMEAELRTAKDSLKQLKQTGENYLTKKISKSNDNEVGDQKSIDTQEPITSRATAAASSTKKWLELRQIWHRDLYRLKKDRDYVPFEYRDLGRHWCRLCNHTSRNLREHLQHLHHESHWKYFDKEHKPWLLPTPIGSFMNKIPMKMGPMKGVEFIVPAKSFMCSICKDLFMETCEIVDHMNSKEHHERYREFVSKNPHYERAYNLDKQAGVQRERIEHRHRVINEQSERDNDCDVGTERGQRSYLDRHSSDRYRGDHESLDRFHDSDQTHESDWPQDREYQERERVLQTSRFCDRNVERKEFNDVNKIKPSPPIRVDDSTLSKFIKEASSEADHSSASYELKESPNDSRKSVIAVAEETAGLLTVELLNQRSSSQADESGESNVTKDPLKMRSFKKKQSPSEMEEQTTFSKGETGQDDTAAASKCTSGKSKSLLDVCDAAQSVLMTKGTESFGSRKRKIGVDVDSDEAIRLLLPAAKKSRITLTKKEKESSSTAEDATKRRKKKEKDKDKELSDVKKKRENFEGEETLDDVVKHSRTTNERKQQRRQQKSATMTKSSSSKKDVDFDDFLRDIGSSADGHDGHKSTPALQITSVLSLPNLPVAAAADYSKCVVVLDVIPFKLRKGSCLARDAESLVERMKKSVNEPVPKLKPKVASQVQVRIKSKKKQRQSSLSRCLNILPSSNKANDDSFTDSLSSLSSESDSDEDVDDNNLRPNVKKGEKGVGLTAPNAQFKKSTIVNSNSYSDSDTSVSELLERSKRRQVKSTAVVPLSSEIKSQIDMSFSDKNIDMIKDSPAQELSHSKLFVPDGSMTTSHVVEKCQSNTAATLPVATPVVQKFNPDIDTSSSVITMDIFEDFLTPASLEHCATEQAVPRDPDFSQSNVNHLNAFSDTSLFENYEIEPLSADMIHVLDILEVEDAIDLY